MKYIKTFESYSLNEWFFNRRPQSEIEEEKRNILKSMREFIRINFYMDAEKLTDDQSSSLSFNISQKIEKEMQYPGQIKVTVIRETRAVSFAK